MIDMGAIKQADSRDLPIENESVELVVTSPPYNLGVDYDEHDDTLPEDEYVDFLTDVFSECYRTLKPDGRMAVVVGVGTGQPLRDRPESVKEVAKSVEFSLRDLLIWDKGDSESSSAWGSWRSASNPRQIFTHEHILVFYKDEPGRLEKKAETLPKDEFMKFVKSVWRVKPETGIPEHPAPFPPEIPYRLIKLFSYEGDTVLDPFAGAGTTVAVAETLNRNGVGIEISEEYAEMARKRVEQFSLQQDFAQVLNPASD